MKKITEMTHDEIIALDIQDIERLIDIACAEAGVPLLDKAPILPSKPEWNDLNNAFEIECIKFRTRESAEIVQNCLRSQRQNILRFHYGYCTESDLAIKETVYIEKGEEEERDKIDEIYQKELAKYNTLKERYDTMIGNRQTLADPIYKAWDDARAKESVRQMLRREASRYLDLAEGNIQVANNFLAKAFPDALAKVADIFNPTVYMTDISDELQTCQSETPDETFNMEGTE